MACMSIPGQSSEMRLEIRAAHAGYGAGVMDDTRGGGRRTHWGWGPHHSLGNKPAVYGQLLICWVIIPFYPQLNQQQNNTLHKRRKVASPTTAGLTVQRETEERSNVQETAFISKWQRRRGERKKRRGKDHSIKMKMRKIKNGKQDFELPQEKAQCKVTKVTKRGMRNPHCVCALVCVCVSVLQFIFQSRLFTWR